ncbi:MAG TPA: Npt1/Npt2 family nucleotide transporter [Thermoanaerobaculia bacterium]|nr:Npt1/Npt2 family nucleotide transporter [Thermoanaerobaculia bacterium]
MTAQNSRWRHLLSRLGVRFDPGEAGPAFLLFLIFFLLITFQYTTKSVRQSTFINSLGAERLPYVYLFIALASYPFLRIYSRFADRHRRDNLIVATCLFTAGTMVLFWWLYEFPWQWVAFAFYVWISITVVMLVSQFWLFSNHVFDPRQAKRLFAFVGAGGLLGGVIGGQLAKFATRAVGTRYALLVAAVVLFLVAALIVVTRRMRGADERRVGGSAGLERLNEARGGFELLRRSRHLRLVAAIMLLTVIVAQIVDLQFNWAVQEATSSLDQRTAFFGNFYSVMGIMAFLFQLIFTARIHRHLGVGFAMRVLPVTMTFGTLALIAAATGAPELLLGAALVLKVGENGVRYSLDQATRELLYLPIPSRARTKAKAFIDVFVQRAAKGVAALLLLPVTFGLFTAPQAGWISLGLIALWIGVTIMAQRQYVESFRAGLKKSVIEPDAIDLNDATALDAVVQSLGSTDARQVIHALRLLQKYDRVRLVPPLLLYHDSPAVRRAVLRMMAAIGRADALPLVERCLSDGDAGVRAEAVSAVAHLRKTDVVSLMRPYLDARDAGAVSAAVVALWEAPDAEIRRHAEAALTDLVTDGDPGARAEAAKALGSLRRDPRNEALLFLLGDRDTRVAREAIGAVRRRVVRGQPTPIYVPSLVALLDNRRLKHEARQALVAFGEAVIPALVHFMNSADERLWVRRALPKTIAMIGGRAAGVALASSLRLAADRILFRKVVEALGTMNEPLPGHERSFGDAIVAQSATYLGALANLAALGSVARGRLAGPLMMWDPEEHEPTLLERLLAEQMSDSVRNIFGLLVLFHDRAHVRDAHRSVSSGQFHLISAAVEYLDNVLAPATRRVVLPVIEDQPLAERLDAAKRLFGINLRSRMDVLTQFVEECLADRLDGSGWGAAALYEVYASRASLLYPRVDQIRNSEHADPLARETAEWIGRRIDRLRGETHA